MKLFDRIRHFIAAGDEPVDTESYDEASRRLDDELHRYRQSRAKLSRKLSTSPGEVERSYFPPVDGRGIEAP